MTLPQLTTQDFLPLLPAIILSSAAIVLMLSEAFLTSEDRTHQAPIALLASVTAGAFAGVLFLRPAREVFQGMGVLDPLSMFVTAVICLALAIVTLLAAGFLRARHAERGEFYALALFAGAGMSLLSLSAELITLFISLEILSVATYALTAYLRRGPRPAEAAFKYFLLGAFSSSVFLYGTALLYGATGSTHLSAIASALPGAIRQMPALAYCGVALIAAGLAFKVAAVPFHMWTPDVYEGAPTPVTALMSAGVKAAAFAALVRVFWSLGQGVTPKLTGPLFSTLALLTMVFGNLLALPQRNVKRMLAYSSISHAGYVLLGLASLFTRGTANGDGGPLASALSLSVFNSEALTRATALRGILFYLLAYTVTTVGAFGIVGVLERRDDEEKPNAWDLDRFSGLAQRRPAMALAMAAFMLSLGGIPPTAGFMAKLLIFEAAVDSGIVGLAVIGVLSSAVGVYYYLRVVVYMFMRPAPEEPTAPEPSWATNAALVLSTAAVLWLGIAPGTVSGLLTATQLMFGMR
jgi:NADH-quinone oxidoreductase subunit N